MLPNKPYQNATPPIPQGMSAETDLLFRKWLKMQITGAYISIFFKIVIAISFVVSIVISTKMLVPIVEKQMGVLIHMQNTLSKLSTVTNSDEVKPVDISDIIKGMLPGTSNSLNEISQDKQAHDQQIEDLESQ